jgi:hypothetical protein
MMKHLKRREKPNCLISKGSILKTMIIKNILVLKQELTLNSWTCVEELRQSNLKGYSFSFKLPSYKNSISSLIKTNLNVICRKICLIRHFRLRTWTKDSRTKLKTRAQNRLIGIILLWMLPSLFWVKLLIPKQTDQF